jgi:hypothetical protein
MFSNFFFRKSCPLWDNAKKYGTARQSTEVYIVQHMCTACWMTKATDTHSDYVIFPAFQRQQLSRERSPLLHLYVPVSRLRVETTVLTSCQPSNYVPGWQNPNLDKTGSFHISLHSLLDAVCKWLYKAAVWLVTFVCRSAHPHGRGQLSNGRIFLKFLVTNICQNM